MLATLKTVNQRVTEQFSDNKSARGCEVDCKIKLSQLLILINTQPFRNQLPFKHDKDKSTHSSIMCRIGTLLPFVLHVERAQYNH